MQIVKRLVLSGVAAAALAAGPGAVLAQQAPAPEATAELHAFFDEQWERVMREYPTFASYLGDRRYNDQWTDESLEAIERRHQEERQSLERLMGIDRASLSSADQLNHDLFRKELEQRLEGYRFRAFLMPVDQKGGVHQSDQILQSLRFETVKDYEDWIARLRKLSTVVDQNIVLMEQGLAEKRMPPRILLERVPSQIAAHLAEDPEQSPMYAPFREIREAIPEADRHRLRAEAQAAISEGVLPAFRKLAAFVEQRYMPAARESVGVWDLPDGEAFYAFRVKQQTTTDLTADEIHEIGLAEVQRIRAEMDKIIQKVGFTGSFEEFLTFLRTDPQFYYTDPQALLEGYQAVSKRLDPELVRLFGKLPRMPYGVKPIPDTLAPDTTTAYYNPPAADGSRAGTYYVNLYKPEVRPKYEMEVLSVHEAVPGHHLQIALAMELGELPKFRRYGGFTAFVEGWGLYSESLGEEMGLYQDPYSKFGQLTYEMWRAVRLVVDTGMHHKQWPRSQAIDFFKANAAKTEHDIVNEIDRYIAWPGQALAYKIGELKIKELRRRATEQLGEKFDIRAFHDVVLGSGGVPLDILERNVDAWIQKTAAAPAGT
jgi:uncharacterized protein (DUF885 family)